MRLLPTVASDPSRTPPIAACFRPIARRRSGQGPPVRCQHQAIRAPNFSAFTFLLFQSVAQACGNSAAGGSASAVVRLLRSGLSRQSCSNGNPVLRRPQPAFWSGESGFLRTSPARCRCLLRRRFPEPGWSRRFPAWLRTAATLWATWKGRTQAVPHRRGRFSACPSCLKGDRASHCPSCPTLTNCY